MALPGLHSPDDTTAGRLTIEADSLRAVQERIDQFVRGERDMTGLDLYHLLERATPLRDFHMVLRPGPRNRTRSGLQQSYGDHNRLLLLGLDRLCQGDLDWYRGRLDAPGAVADDELLACFAAVHSLELGRPALVAIWLGAALHDCGMLAGHGEGIDADDGVAIARDILDPLCPASFHGLASFAIRNHDYIKDVFRGEVPAGFIAEQLSALAPELRSTALAVLGMIQVAGAASLGEGRLSAFRMAIFRLCVEGTALDDRSVRTRLARLLDDGDEAVEPPEHHRDVPVAHLPAERQATVDRFLERVPVHRWHKAWSSVAGASAATKVVVLSELASRWDGTGSDHVVLADELALPSAISTGWHPPVTPSRLHNGTVALVVG